MATVKRFEDLEIRQKVRRLSKEIIHLSESTGLKYDYRLRDQFKGSLGAVSDIIAEGYQRDGNLEFRQFLSIAKGSAGEVRTQIYRVFDNGHICEDKMKQLAADYEILSRRISNFISYLNKKDFKGMKFKEDQLDTKNLKPETF